MIKTFWFSLFCIFYLTPFLPVIAQPAFDVRPIGSLKNCPTGDVRILPSPDSQNIAVLSVPRDLRDVWTISRSINFAVMSLPKEMSSQKNELTGYGIVAFQTKERSAAVAGVIPVQWNIKNNELLFFHGDKGAATVNPTNGLINIKNDRDPRWTRGPIFALSHGYNDFYQKPANINILQHAYAAGNPIRNNITVSGSEIAVLIFRLGTKHQMIGYDNKGEWNTEIPLAFAQVPLINPINRSVSYLGDQRGYDNIMPYAQPLINLKNGMNSGRFGLETIEQPMQANIELGQHFGEFINIKDAKKNGDAIFALVETEFEQRLVRIRNSQIKSWNYCTIKERDYGGVKVSSKNILKHGEGIKRQFINFKPSEPRGSPFGMLYTPARANGRLLVYFHGGPSISHLEHGIPSTVNRYAKHGVSVLAVEYSGMIGGGLALSQRIQKQGFDALLSDVDIVTKWVRKNNFKSVYLLGGSFGGAPATIAATNYRSDYSQIFFVVPALALRSIDETVNRKPVFGRGAVPTDRQREFEYLIYGDASGRERFNKVLKANVARLKPSANLSFYFGDQDSVSSPDDLPEAFREHANVIVYKSGHDLSKYVQEMDKDILTKMGLQE